MTVTRRPILYVATTLTKEATMKRLTLTVALLLALPAFAQEGTVQLRADVRTEKVVVGGETVWNVHATIYRTDGAVEVPIDRVDEEGNAPERQWYVGLDKVRAECPEGGCTTEAEWRKARDTAVMADLQPRLKGWAEEIEAADSPAPPPPGLERVGGSHNPNIPLDRQYAEKRSKVHELQTDFIDALNATAPDPDNEGQTIAAPDCERAQALLTELTEATELLGADHDAVTRASTAYTNGCGS